MLVIRISHRLVVRAAIMLLGANALVGAQTLDLSVVPAPSLGGSTAASGLVAELEREMQTLESEYDDHADPFDKIRNSAARHYRGLAADVLAAGDRAGADGSIAIVFGLTLASGRRQCDDALQRWAGNELEESVRAKILLLLEAFNVAAETARAQGLIVDLRRPEATLAAVLAPLAQAVAILESTTLAPAWSSATPAPNTAIPSLEDFPARAQAAPLEPQTRETLLIIIDFLQRGESFPELAPRIAQYRALMSHVLECAQALADAAWLRESEAPLVASHIHQALAAFQNPATRQRGEELIDRLSASANAMQRITELSKQRVDVKELKTAFLAAEETIASPDRIDESRRRLEQVALIAERMCAYRGRDPARFKRDLQLVQRDLEKQFRDAEEALLKHLVALGANANPMADPALSTLMTEHEQLLEDCLRLNRVPEWERTMAQLDPPSAKFFENQTRKMCRWLREANRRPDAVAAMDQFGRQLHMFHPMPFEKELSANDPSAIELTGGLHAEIAARIVEFRRAWAVGWSEGHASSDAANRMLLICRLLQTMADAAAVESNGAGLSTLNRWAAWEMDPQAIAGAVPNVIARLKLASAALAAGDDNGLRAQVAKLDDEAPVLKLAARLAQHLAWPVPSSPGGATDVLAQVLFEPEPDTWMIDHRRAVADVCRYALEAQHVRGLGDADAAVKIEQYIDALAQQLLRELGEPPVTWPTIAGFDGSDPDAKAK